MALAFEGYAEACAPGGAGEPARAIMVRRPGRTVVDRVERAAPLDSAARAAPFVSMVCPRRVEAVLCLINIFCAN